MSLNPVKQHPLVTLGVIIFFAVTALVAFRLSSGAETDARKSRVITVGTAVPVKQDLDVRLTYTADLIPNQLVNIFPASTVTSPRCTWIKAISSKRTNS